MRVIASGSRHKPHSRNVANGNCMLLFYWKATLLGKKTPSSLVIYLAICPIRIALYLSTIRKRPRILYFRRGIRVPTNSFRGRICCVSSISTLSAVSNIVTGTPHLHAMGNGKGGKWCIVGCALVYDVSELTR